MSTAPKAEDLRKLISRLDADCIRYFQGATSLCVARTHYEIAPEHLLMRLLDDTTGDVTRILEAFKVDRAAIRRAVQRILDELPPGHRARPALSPKIVEIFQSAAVLADEMGFEQIRSGLVLLAFALNPGHTRVNEYTQELQRIEADQLRDHFREIVQAQAPAAPGAPEAGPAAGGPEGAALQQFTVDMTARAEAGEIDPVFGREAEIRQMIDIFARRRKNNPILVGEPGTGKTAIVEGLALRIVQGDVPPTLKGVRLLILDLGLLQAGAGVRGEFENRLKNVIKEVKASPTPIVLFIDEAHTLVGSGSGGGADAANLLKPALARGELRTVAATTWAEYKKYFEKDAALERRFQQVRCDEPSVDDATVMLRGLKDRYERHHKVIIVDEAVVAAVKLSNRYYSGRFLPDKAVDLLDTASARVAVGLRTRPAAVEDMDRHLSNLDTAIQAIRRDEAGGMTIDRDRLAELEAARAALPPKREVLEKRWQGELQVVERIRELRAKLNESLEAKQSGGGDGKAKPDGAVAAPAGKAAPPATGKAAPPATGEAVPPAAGEAAPAAAGTPPVDEAQLRRQINQAMAELKALQGEQPLVHPHVDQAAVASVLSDWTGIPVGNMVKDEIDAMLHMEDHLRRRVVGQDHALAIIANKLRTSRAGIGNPSQPMGVFLCVGPSGVGKTELALTVADLLFGGEGAAVTLNMSEFMEKHTVSQLKGSPPGYVGYGEGGVLTEAVRKHPYSVVLLDEVEKAHPDVMNLFYQVFDKGNLADGEGRVVNFKNTVILMTSNLGTDVIQGMCESGEEVNADAIKEAIYPQLREHFKPALLARMTIIPFLTLKADILKAIARMKLAKLGKQLAEVYRMAFRVEEPVYDVIVKQCNQVDVGARQVDHILAQQVQPELARLLLAQLAEEKLPAAVTMSANEAGAFVYTFTEQAAAEPVASGSEP